MSSMRAARSFTQSAEDAAMSTLHPAEPEVSSNPSGPKSAGDDAAEGDPSIIVELDVASSAAASASGTDSACDTTVSESHSASEPQEMCFAAAFPEDIEESCYLRKFPFTSCPRRFLKSGVPACLSHALSAMSYA